MIWTIGLCVCGALYGAYKLGKAKQRAEFRHIGRRIEVRRLAAKAANEAKYDGEAHR